MAIAPLQLPGYATPQALDFSSLANLGQVYKTAAADNTRQQTLASLGQGDQIDPKVLIGSGDLTLAQLGVQIQNKQQEQARQAKQDERQTGRDAVDDRFRAASLALQQRAASRADEGPLEKASQRAKAAEQFGLTPGTPEHKTYVLTGELPAGNTTVQAQTEQRKAAAASSGLTPDTPAYQSYILTGKMPREDAQPLTATDKKAILEADDHIQATQQGISNLQQAKELSKKALAGPMAKQIGYAGSLVGNEAATATTDLNNLVTTNALQQLKATFGGNPTEGERAILLDVQGSANQPDAVRQKIYDRAIAAMEKRQAFNQQRSDALRGGSFYKKGGGQTQPQAAAQPAGNDPIALAKDAIARGAPRDAVLKRLQENGIDPSGL